jgi:hypothetical protein
MGTSWQWAAVAAAILAAPIARGHELVCEKKVDGQDVVNVDTYPTTVTYEWTITNALASAPSTADDLEDTLFPEPPFTLPLTLAGGASTSAEQMLTIDSYEECAELAKLTPNGPITLTNTLTVEFDGGSASCDAQVICKPREENGEGCLTRTPGYWGTHPDVTAELLPVESCGLDLTTTEAGEEGSITEDLCSVGKDHKEYGSPQEAQLVRQCAAAALNIAASEFFGGSCEESLSSERFAECCTACGGTGSEIAASGCIEDLDDFNNSADTLLEDSSEINLCRALELSSCAADPSECQAAGGNAFVNDRSTAAVAMASSPTAGGPTSGGCSGGPGGLLALLGTAGLLALRRRR